MNLLKVCKTEAKSLGQNKIKVIAIIAIMIIPLLYTFCYLKAYWDPYGDLRNYHVAIVNNDTGSTLNSESVNYGNDAVKKLKENKKVGFVFVNDKTAKNGLKSGKYFAYIEIPTDFSEKIASAKDGKAIAPTLKYVSNNKKNYIGTKISGNIKTEILSQMKQSISEKYGETAFDSIYEARDGLKDASTGTDKIVSGTDTIKSGSDTLASGLNQFNGQVPVLTGAISQLNNGAIALNSGIGTERNGIITLNSTTHEAGGNILNFIDNIGRSKIYAYASDSSNVGNIKKLANDGLVLKNADTSGLTNAGTLLNSKNLGLISTTVSDVSEAQIYINKINALAASANLTPTEMSNLQKLLKDSGSLGSIDTTKLQSISALFDTQNAGKIRDILSQAQNLSNVDTDSMSTFITTQLAQINKYHEMTHNPAGALIDADTAKNSKNVAALEAAIDKAYPTASGNAQLIAANTQLKQLAEGYYTATKSADDSMQASTSTLNTMQSNINGLANVKQTLKDNSGLISGMSAALSDTNVQYMNQMLSQLINLKSEFAANSQTITKLQTLLGSLDPNEVSAALTKVNDIQNDITAAKPMLTALSDPNMQAQLASAPKLINQLTTMKKDLDDNQKLLDVAQDALSDNNLAQAQSIIAAIPSYKDKIATLESGTTQLENGINQVYTGSGQLSSGLTTLNGKTSLLACSTQQLADGSSKLATSLTTLNNGQKDLQTGLNDGIQKINNNVKSSSKSLGKFVGEPIKVSETNIDEIDNYGTGLAPYFLPISLWLGAVLMMLILKINNDKYKGLNRFELTIGKYLNYAVLGVIQALLLGGVVYIIGIKPAHPIALFASLIVAALGFDAVLYGLVSLLGLIGEGLAIILLVLQLCSDAGTFPIESLPTFFRGIANFLPFTYFVEIAREVMFANKINTALVFKDLGIICLFGLIALGFVFVFIKKGQEVNNAIEDSLNDRSDKDSYEEIEQAV